jgi:beta-lactamase superfamily II metal-dependent hydrolase
MEMAFELPSQGFVFWPIGTGDSTTVVIKDGVVVQVDLHHLVAAEDKEDPRTPLLDRLIPLLPKRNGKPYLALFVLTHPDQDHCRGFADLLKRVTIGELWFTPRIFREYKKELCDDAVAFKKEAKRRVEETIEEGELPPSGHRVRIFGYDELLEEEEFEGFPKNLLTVPGHAITGFDGVDYKESFRAFVHAPFKDDCDGERNDTSLALQITLKNGGARGRALLLGDLCYPTVKKIFEVSKANENDAKLWWNVFLAPHHCSKSVMYWKVDDKVTLQQDVLDMIAGAAKAPAYIVASSDPIPGSNESGDCPPHAKAKKRYMEIVEGGHFLCTQEHPNETDPQPIVFRLNETGLEYVAPVATKADSKATKALSLESAIATARGSAEPPRDRVGFGEE